MILSKIDGLSYGDYVEQLTYLLSLKMAGEHRQPRLEGSCPSAWTGRRLWACEGPELDAHGDGTGGDRPLPVSHRPTAIRGGMNWFLTASPIGAVRSLGTWKHDQRPHR